MSDLLSPAIRTYCTSCRMTRLRFRSSSSRRSSAWTLRARETQLLVLTPDSETAVLIAEAATRARTGTPARVLPVTAWRRAVRLQRVRPATVIAGTPSDILELIRASAIKLDSVNTLVLAWADVMSDAAGEPLEAVMAEVPKDAARVIVASHLTPAVEALAERYARRARRSHATPVVEGVPVDLRYVAIAPQARASALAPPARRHGSRARRRIRALR